MGGFPGPASEVLGIWNEEIDALHDEERRLVRWNGKKYQARDFCEIIHAKGAVVQGQYEDDFYACGPAVTCNSYGSGKAWYVAARLDRDFQTDFFTSLINDLGITRPLAAQLPAGCTAQVRTDGDNEYVFLMNFMPRPVTIDVGEGGESLSSGKKLQGLVELPERGLEIVKRPAVL